eukprot:12127803-Alexandrium_andersonii.AAC.1
MSSREEPRRNQLLGHNCGMMAYSTDVPSERGMTRHTSRVGVEWVARPFSSASAPRGLTW